MFKVEYLKLKVKGLKLRVGKGTFGRGHSFNFQLLAFNFLFWLFACGNAPQTDGFVPPSPDYSRADMWYVGQNDSAGTQVDVFYIAPTCVWDWTAPHGQVSHYMNVSDSAQRAAVDASNLLACRLLGKHCRFFSPYYRQITMNSWFLPPAGISRLYSLAHSDIVRAFGYYMEHINGGRPFVLAGHSQGAKAVIELIKHTLTPDRLRRMVAAYSFGFSVSRAELAAFPALRPARGVSDTGVLICYNSVSHAGAVSPLFAGNAVCINPINWRTDTVAAPAADNPGSVFFDAAGRSDTLFHQVGARIDMATGHLLVSGLDDEKYFIPSIARLFPRGNYHVQELNLYFLSVQRNLDCRIAAFLGR